MFYNLFYIIYNLFLIYIFQKAGQKSTGNSMLFFCNLTYWLNDAMPRVGFKPPRPGPKQSFPSSISPVRRTRPTPPCRPRGLRRRSMRRFFCPSCDPTWRDHPGGLGIPFWPMPSDGPLGGITPQILENRSRGPPPPRVEWS